MVHWQFQLEIQFKPIFKFKACRNKIFSPWRCQRLKQSHSDLSRILAKGKAGFCLPEVQSTCDPGLSFSLWVLCCNIKKEEEGKSMMRKKYQLPWGKGSYVRPAVLGSPPVLILLVLVLVFWASSITQWVAQSPCSLQESTLNPAPSESSLISLQGYRSCQLEVNWNRSVLLTLPPWKS